MVNVGDLCSNFQWGTGCNIIKQHTICLLQVELPSYKPLLTDFGLACMLSDRNVMASVTSAPGTPGFQAPEQLQRNSQHTSCDVYAFGGVLVVLFGEKPLWCAFAKLLPSYLHGGSCNGVYPNVLHLQHHLQHVCKLCFAPAEHRPSMNKVVIKLMYWALPCDLKCILRCWLHILAQAVNYPPTFIYVSTS